MEAKKIRVFLDTNPIVQSGYLRGTMFQAFIKAAHLLEIEVVIPEIVIDEVTGKFHKELAEKIESFKSAQQGLNQMIDAEELHISAEEETATFSESLNALLQDYKVKLLPYPKTPLKEIVTTSYTGQKPFKKDGAGYKDFIIWRTICIHLEKEKGMQNFFITNNIADFCEKKDEKCFLHPFLASQIKRGIDVPQVCVSLKEFFDENIEPHLKGLKPSDIVGLDLSKNAIKILESELSYYSAFGFEGLGFSNDVSIVYVEDINFESTALKELSKDEVLITLEGTLSADIHGFMEKSDYYHSFEEGRIGKVYVIDGDHNDWVMAVGGYLTMPFELTLTYKKSTKEIINHAIELPSEIMTDYYS